MKMPVIFVGHGSPMNALAQNPWTETIRKMGEDIPRPKAILCISAHWTTRGVKVLTVDQPKTIHDFGGFPDELFQIQYPAVGSKEASTETLKLLKPFLAQADQQWGLDHGTWSVLLHMFPKADVPVFQVSIDQALSEKGHVEIGKDLRKLREEGVLILGSGNIVHNLRLINFRNPNAPPFPWAIEFDSEIKKCLESRDEDALVFHKQKFGESSRLSVPTDEHYLPLLYCFGASAETDTISFPFEGFEMGSLSMRAVKWSAS